jgi:hypothetical protein
MAWDGARNQVVMITSSDASATWTWDGTGWVRHARGIRPPVSDSFPSSAVYDPVRHRVVAVVSDQYARTFGDTWTWTGATWEQTGGDGTFVVLRPALGYDEARRELLVVGDDPDDAGVIHTWILHGSEWTSMSPSLTGQVTLSGPTHIAFDRSTNRLLLFRGAQTQPVICHGPTPVQGESMELSSCAPPPPDYVHPMAWNGQRWVHANMTAPNGVVMSDPTGPGLLDLVPGNGKTSGVWRWDGRRWARVAALPLPTTVTSWSVAPDPDAGQLVLFGGTETNGGWQPVDRPIDQTWTFDGAHWTLRSGSSLPKLPPPATPPPPPACDAQPASIRTGPDGSGDVILSVQLPLTGTPGKCVPLPGRLRLETAHGTPLTVSGNPADLAAGQGYSVMPNLVNATWRNWCHGSSGIVVHLTTPGFELVQPIPAPSCISTGKPSTLVVFHPVMEQ